jgi:hypothetical protein
MNKHQHDRERIERRPHRDIPQHRYATDRDRDAPRRFRHAPYHREKHPSFDEWDSD